MCGMNKSYMTKNKIGWWNAPPHSFHYHDNLLLFLCTESFKPCVEYGT